MKRWPLPLCFVAVLAVTLLALFSSTPSPAPAPRTSPTPAATAPSVAPQSQPFDYECPLYCVTWEKPGTLSVFEFTVDAFDIDETKSRGDINFTDVPSWTDKQNDRIPRDDDFTGSGYHRGHLRADSLSDGSPDHEFASCWANVAPMTPELNLGLYRRFELELQKLAIESGPVHVTIESRYDPEVEMPLCGRWTVPSHYFARMGWIANGKPEFLAYLMPQKCNGVNLKDCEVAP